MNQQNDPPLAPSSRGGQTKNLVQSWFLLTVRRYPPLKYLIYSCLFVGAIQMVDSDTSIAVSFAQNLRLALGIFLLLWFMRIVDEIKDLEYDRQFHPHRPLASGEVSVGNAFKLLTLIGTLITIDAFAQNWITRSLALAIMLYSLLLWATEQAWLWFRECMTVNIVFAIQLKTLLVLFVSAGLPGDATRPVPSGLLAIAIVCSYLHWEILRKTNHEAIPDKAYSNEIGTWPSLALGLLLLTTAFSIMIFYLRPVQCSVPLLSIVVMPSLIGILGFARHRFGQNTLSILSLTGYLLFLTILTWFHKMAALFQN